LLSCDNGDVRGGRCGTENGDTAKFCGECGGRLERSCTDCGAQLANDLKFCDQCGAPTAAVAETTPAASRPDAARKLVTVAFVDLGGSTAFGEVVDAETARSVMLRPSRHARNLCCCFWESVVAWGCGRVGVDR
jgi:hypothetical protein